MNNCELAETHYQEYVRRLMTVLTAIPMKGIDALAEAVYATYVGGRRLFVAGNGGSAATAAHMACDLSKGTFAGNPNASSSRFGVISLADNVAVMTAWANDTSYDRIFAEQLRILGEPGDALLVISASGDSPSIIEAITQARTMEIKTIGLLGFTGGKAKELVDVGLVVPDNAYGLVEDGHMIVSHFLTEYLRRRIANA